MLEKNIVDRVPTYPGRIILTPVEGMPDTFTMARADEPTVEGTPLDKATFDSIIQSRLTGRFYVPTFSRLTANVTTVNSNPIPSSGWVTNGATEATNGQYRTTASESQDNPAEAFDGTWSTSSGWRPSHDDDEPWIALDLGSPIVLKSVKMYFVSDAWATTCTLAGSNNGTSWTNIATIDRPKENGAMVWTFDNTVSYQHYRLTFDNTGVELYGWELTQYTITTYKNEFTVNDNWATEWTVGQLALISIPSNVTTLGVVSNTINGISVNTILQPSRRYELRYTGTAFVAKEV